MASEHGGGDPARTLAVLWRVNGRAARKDLGVDRIVAAAVELADAEGLGALSMRRVADRLGVGTMSLYTHVPGKSELVDAMVDAVQAETARPPHAPGAWRASLTAIARENRALHLRHPWLLEVVAHRAVLGPHVAAKYDYELGAVDGIGLGDVEMDSVLTLVLAHVRAAARIAVEAEVARRRTGLTDEQWWRAAAPFLAKVFDPDRFPLAARVGAAAGEEHGAAYQGEHAFAFGLERVLDGIEALVRSRRQ
ncbi:TetR/AcrR family transcriptional regulator [Saccharothrix lopnurensis]|uniref:TetR/AcrR family transcriptional regulator n=1 Tax=Saccharothrix lopnurensis TaxID=1670621 RepID=A0ABW1P409_9PSEU